MKMLNWFKTAPPIITVKEFDDDDDDYIDDYREIDIETMKCALHRLYIQRSLSESGIRLYKHIKRKK